MREFGGNISTNPLTNPQTVAQDTQSVLPHLLSGEELWQPRCEIEAELEFAGGERHP
jgi:hypothetical protein